MPTFNDFNFGDDSASVDTDPTPDNDNLDTNQSTPTDGIQDDQTNFPEPGQNDTFEGGEPTAFDVQGNAEEPGAQQDHTPPVASVLTPTEELWKFLALRVKPAPNPTAELWNYLAMHIPPIPNQIAAREALNEHIALIKSAPPVPTIDLLPLKEYLKLLRAARPTEDEARHAEQDAAFAAFAEEYADKLSISDMAALARDIAEKGRHKNLTAEGARKVTKRLWDAGERAILGGRKIPVTIDDDDTSPVDNDISDDDVFSAVEFLMMLPDGLINDIFDDASMVALIDSFNNKDASGGYIEGLDDFANPTDNPSGIGELFDQLLVSGHDAFISIDNSQDIDGLVASDFLSLDQYDDAMDIRDYVGDVTLNSDIIEFQNMGQNVLENFDGVL